MSGNAATISEVQRCTPIRYLRSLVERCDILFVEGDPGIGTSTLLCQFGQQYSSDTCTCILQTGTRIGYDPELVLGELCAGVAGLLDETCGTSEHTPLSTGWRNLLAIATRRVRYRSRFVLVVDGLHQIPEHDRTTRDEILDLLPIPSPAFRLVLSGSPDLLPVRSRSKAQVRTTPLQGFTVEECRELLGSPDISEAALHEVLDKTAGNPTALLSVRRLLDAGTPTDQIIPTLTESPPDIFELEWRTWDRTATDESRKLLALLAFDDQHREFDQLSHILGVQESRLRAAASSIRFLRISNGVQYTSTLFKEFAAKKLNRLRDEALAVLTRYLLREPDAEDALLTIPTVLSRQGRESEVLDYLTENRFAQALRTAGSTAKLCRSTDIALAAAYSTKQFGQLVRFALHRATLASMCAPRASEEELRALIAVGDVDGAISIARSSPVSEDRLVMLAIVARSLKNHGITLPPDLRDEIAGLCEGVDLTEYGNQRASLAENLLFVQPDVAMRMLDTIAGRESSDRDRSWLYTALSVRALQQSQLDESDALVLSNLANRISDPVAKLIADYARQQGETDADNVISEASALGDTDKAVHLIAAWANTDPCREGTTKAIDAALDLATAATDYVAEARALRQLAEALCAQPTRLDVQRIIEKFDRFNATLERIGPTREYVGMQLAIAATEWDVDKSKAKDRLESTILFASEVDDAPTRAGCLAELAGQLDTIDPCRELDERDELHSLVQHDLSKAIDTALAATAEPHVTLAGTVAALARTDTALAVALAKRFTSPARRSVAIASVVHIRAYSTGATLDEAARLLDLIEDPELRALTAIQVLEGLTDPRCCVGSSVTGLEKLLASPTHLGGDHHCHAICLALEALDHWRIGADVSEKLLAQLEATWHRMEDGYQKSRTGFRIAHSLARTKREIAISYIEQGRLLRDSLVLGSVRSAVTYEYCVRLAIRAFHGLARHNRERPESFDDVKTLIGRVRCCPTQIRLWTDLALRCDLSKQRERCAAIVRESIQPLLTELSKRGRIPWEKAVAEAAPALYRTQPLAATSQLRGLDSPTRDEAFFSIAMYLVTGTAIDEPIRRPPDGAFAHSFDEALEAIEVAREVTSDSMIHVVLEAVASTARQGRFTREQKTAVATKIRELAEAVFPAEKYVPHDGYRIICLAHAESVQRRDPEQLALLAERARAIPNASDRALVLAAIAGYQPQHEREPAVGEVLDTIEQLDSVHDKYLRYVDLAQFLIPCDRTRARKVVELARQASFQSGVRHSSRRLIDVAHLVDEQLARSIAIRADNDPARFHSERRAHEHFRVLQLARQVCGDTFQGNPRDLSSAAWRALAEANAGRLAFTASSGIWALIRQGANYPLDEAYPIFSLALRAAADKFGGTRESAISLHAVLDGVVSGARVVLALSGERFSCASSRMQQSDLTLPENILVRVGQRHHAESWLSRWLSRHARERIVVCDPYFTVDDLGLLCLIAGAAPERVSIRILTGRDALRGISGPPHEAFIAHWNAHVSSIPPPPTQILVVSSRDGKTSPIHDRWWLTEGVGLKHGTSFSGLGQRDSQISCLSHAEFGAVSELVAEYWDRRVPGDGLSYVEFSLG